MNMRFTPSLFFLLSVVLLNACTKSPEKKPQAFVRLLQGVPNAPDIDLAPDAKVLIGGVGFGSASNYISADAGGFNIRLQTNGGTSIVTNGDIVTAEGSYYTLVVTDSLFRAKSSVVLDNRSDPPAGKAFIRFFHLVGNGPDYTVNRSGSALFSNRAFNDQAGGGVGASYTAIDPGTLTFELRQATGGSIVSVLPTVSIAAGKSYTLIAKGFVGGTDKQAVALGLFTDK
jgi:Domain of unknown function (DUF4397)